MTAPEPAAFAALWSAAARAGDDATRLALLRGADLVLPLPATGSPTWPVSEFGGRTWITVWTDPELMGGLAGPQWWRSSFVELVHAWPDLRWGLAVDPGTPHPLLVEPGALVQLLAPEPADELALDPQRAIWVQHLVAAGEAAALLQGSVTRVSGVVHRVEDVAHIGAPTVLLAAVGRTGEERELIPDDGTVLVLRWPVFGAALYRVPPGSTGLGAGTVPVREYRVDDVALPHGAALVELDARGRETERARLDAVRGVWQLVTREPVA